MTGGKADTQLGTDELLISGELNMFCLYETAEGKTGLDKPDSSV